MRKIVVGVDGSAHGTAALRWADREAQRHGASLVAVMAWTLLEQHHADGEDRFDPSYSDEAAAAALAAVVAEVRPQVDVEQRVTCDIPASALVDASEGADLLVVGARGLGGFKGLLLGSVSERVLERGSCPVAIVRRDMGPAEDGPVVVGIDGSREATAALHWAAAEAACRRSQLHVVHGWSPPASALSTSAAVNDALEECANDVVEAALADDELAGLDVVSTVRRAGAAVALLEATSGASLVVVGTRGRGAIGGLFLGSTSRQVAHHASAPVVVVRHTS